MPCSALPKHLQQDPYAEGDATDHDNKAQKWWSRCWKAFGPNATEKYGWVGIAIPFTKYRIPLFPLLAKWRRFPLVLIGYNIIRFMGKNDCVVVTEEKNIRKFLFFRRRFYYIDKETRQKQWIGPSVIQKGTKGLSFMWFWPFGFCLSYTFNFKGAERVFFARGFARPDSLDDYWVFPAFFIGFSWN